ncbi:unnamed protein product, partial [Mesorhabditis belari]|uniref:Uncharacterized protein n=1 Tax=Mesorhabditis belari TaxID=2138241 RepID=A0AAF3J4Y5_9BILA
MCLGFLDFICTIFSSEISGFFYIVGAEYCMYPHLQYISGCVIVGCFASICLLSLFLVGNKTWFYIGVSLFYGLISFWKAPSVVFNVDYGTWLYHPFIPGKIDLEILMQAICVCFFTFTTTTLWASMIFYNPSKLILHLGQLSWHLMHGVPSLVYLLLNKTIQRKALRNLSNVVYRQRDVNPITSNNIIKSQEESRSQTVYRISANPSGYRSRAIVDCPSVICPQSI